MSSPLNPAENQDTRANGLFNPSLLVEQLKNNYENLTEAFQDLIPVSLKHRLQAEASSWRLKQHEAKESHKPNADHECANQKKYEEQNLKLIEENEELSKLVEKKDEIIAIERSEKEKMRKDYEYLLERHKELKKVYGDKLNEINQHEEMIKNKEKKINAKEASINQVYEFMKKSIIEK